MHAKESPLVDYRHFLPLDALLLTAVRQCAAGEAAGLRVPALGRNVARQPHWAAYNLLFHSALPPFEGRKAHTRELPAQVPPPGPRCICASFCATAFPSFLVHVTCYHVWEQVAAPPPELNLESLVPSLLHDVCPSVPSGWE